jgi:hypothetical protein
MREQTETLNSIGAVLHVLIMVMPSSSSSASEEGGTHLLTVTMGAEPLGDNISAAGVMAVAKVVATVMDSVQTLKSTITDPWRQPNKSVCTWYRQGPQRKRPHTAVILLMTTSLDCTAIAIETATVNSFSKLARAAEPIGIDAMSMSYVARPVSSMEVEFRFRQADTSLEPAIDVCPLSQPMQSLLAVRYW